MRGSRRSKTWAIETLRYQMMPEREIRSILATDDPVILHRYLELHQERLQEWVVEQLRVIERLERFLTEDVGERPGGMSVGARIA